MAFATNWIRRLLRILLHIYGSVKTHIYIYIYIIKIKSRQIPKWCRVFQKLFAFAACHKASLDQGIVEPN